MKAAAYLFVALLAGCSAETSVPGGHAQSAGAAGMAPATGAGAGTGTGGAAADACATGVSVSPAPLRRLTRGEFDHAARDLLHSGLQLAQDFPNDLPAAGFASNRADPMSLLGVEKLMQAAEALAVDAITRLDALVPCPATQRDAACAQQFIGALGRKAYRRSLTSAEQTELSAL